MVAKVARFVIGWHSIALYGTKVYPLVFGNFDNFAFQLWQMFFNDVPDERNIHAQIMVREYVPRPGNLHPRHLRMRHYQILNADIFNRLTITSRLRITAS